MKKDQYLKYIRSNDFDGLLIEEFYHEAKGVLNKIPPQEVLGNIRTMASLRAQQKLESGLFSTPQDEINNLIQYTVTKYEAKYNIHRLFFKGELLRIY